MSTSPVSTATDPVAVQSLRLLQEILAEYHPRDFDIRLWDGTRWPAETDKPRFTLVLKHPAALRQAIRPRELEVSLGEGYIYDDFDIEGDIEGIFEVADFLTQQHWGLEKMLKWGWELYHLPKNGHRPRTRAAQVEGEEHSIQRDRQAISYHYDVSNEFFALWLDSRMVYSCAYFKTPDDDLDTAQLQKLDYICRKLRLQPGERLLDIGCGWGGLIIHAAQHYGVEAVGITLSENQAEFANQRIREMGLADRCRVELADYRELSPEKPFDKLVSVGMFEHVGEAKLETYFRQAWQLLKPGGVFLNHGIAYNARRKWRKGPTFTNRYVFPDGELVPINTTLHYAEKVGFEVRDVESLREHYALTLRHWVKRLEARHEEAVRATDEVTYRIWRLYMAGSAHGFATGHLNVYQSLLAKPDHGVTGLPLTREDWYCPENKVISDQ